MEHEPRWTGHNLSPYGQSPGAIALAGSTLMRRPDYTGR